MSDWVKDVPVKSEFSQRYVELLQANLTADVLEAVDFNVIEHLRQRGMFRDDRPVVVKREKMARSEFESREAVIMLNDSDAQVLRQLLAFKNDPEKSMDLHGEGEEWYAYIIGETDRLEV